MSICDRHKKDLEKPWTMLCSNSNLTAMKTVRPRAGAVSPGFFLLFDARPHVNKTVRLG